MNHDDLGNYTHSYVKQQIAEAYRKGQEHMRDRCIDRLGDYEANKCAQIVAGVEVKEKSECGESYGG